jgi:hypothetical protein
MQKILAQLFVLAVLVLLQIGVSVYGWGLTPRNWWWIIGVGLFGNVFMKVIGDKAMK